MGHYTRSFTLSNKIDQETIGAHIEDGVLTLNSAESERGAAAADFDRMKLSIVMARAWLRP